VRVSWQFVFLLHSTTKIKPLVFLTKQFLLTLFTVLENLKLGFWREMVTLVVITRANIGLAVIIKRK